jgi:uncharacterized protein YgbK (DUF1537 family)
MKGVRVLADDLSGALDTAVFFTGHSGSLRVARTAPYSGIFACSTAARDLPVTAAAEAFARHLPWLLEGERPFCKVDSRLRGHAASEIAAIREAAPGRPILVAPGLPGQGRVVRSGRVWARDHRGQAWRREPVALVDELGSLGHDARVCPPSDRMIPEGISVWDTETDDDLDRIAAAAIAVPGIILCGSSGLAAAFARVLGIPPPARRHDLPRPMLLIAGTVHPQTLRQIEHLDAVAPGLHSAVATEEPAFGAVAAALARGQSQLVTPLLPALREQPQISRRIAAWLGCAARTLPRPGSLFVTGGETLDTLMQALSAEGLTVTGQIAEGVPFSRFSGGRWDGLDVVSKSGGFGAADLFSKLIFD